MKMTENDLDALYVRDLISREVWERALAASRGEGSPLDAGEQAEVEQLHRCSARFNRDSALAKARRR